MRLVGDGALVASCLMLRGGGFWPDAAQRWLLVRCCAAVASCPMLRGTGFIVICRRMYCARRARVEGVKVLEMSSKMWRIEDDCREM